jgi:hypothetical protein
MTILDRMRSLTLPKSAADKAEMRKRAYDFLGVTPEAVA